MSGVKIKPLGERVLLERLKVGEQTTEGGLVIPSREDPTSTFKNKVIAKGDGVTRPVEVGDVVITTPHIGDKVSYEQEEFYLVDQTDLLAVIDNS